MYLLEDEDSGYEEIRSALLGCTAMTFAAAAEFVFTADKGSLVLLPITKAGDKLFRWVKKMTEGAETIRQANDRVTVGVLRSLMSLTLRITWT